MNCLGATIYIQTKNPPTKSSSVKIPEPSLMPNGCKYTPKTSNFFGNFYEILIWFVIKYPKIWEIWKRHFSLGWIGSPEILSACMVHTCEIDFRTLVFVVLNSSIEKETCISIFYSKPNSKCSVRERIFSPFNWYTHTRIRTHTPTNNKRIIYWHNIKLIKRNAEVVPEKNEWTFFHRQFLCGFFAFIMWTLNNQNERNYN